jgi:hypothetical protein
MRKNYWQENIPGAEEERYNQLFALSTARPIVNKGVNKTASFFGKTARILY